MDRKYTSCMYRLSSELMSRGVDYRSSLLSAADVEGKYMTLSAFAAWAKQVSSIDDRDADEISGGKNRTTVNGRPCVCIATLSRSINQMIEVKEKLIKLFRCIKQAKESMSVTQYLKQQLSVASDGIGMQQLENILSKYDITVTNEQISVIFLILNDFNLDSLISFDEFTKAYDRESMYLTGGQSEQINSPRTNVQKDQIKELTPVLRDLRNSLIRNGYSSFKSYFEKEVGVGNAGKGTQGPDGRYPDHLINQQQQTIDKSSFDKLIRDLNPGISQKHVEMMHQLCAHQDGSMYLNKLDKYSQAHTPSTNDSKLEEVLFKAMNEIGRYCMQKKRNCLDIFLPSDMQRTGLLPDAAFFDSLKNNGVMLTVDECDRIRRRYSNKDFLIDYKAFHKDLLITSHEYASSVGHIDTRQRTANELLVEVLKLVVEKYPSVSDWACDIDKNKKKYVNRSDLLQAFNSFKPAVDFTEDQFQAAYVKLNPKKENKIFYYLLEERVIFLLQPIVQDISGRILNGYDMSKVSLNDKILKNNYIKGIWIKTDDIVKMLKEYDPKLLDNHIQLLISYLEVPINDKGRVKYADFKTSYYSLLEKLQLREKQVIDNFFNDSKEAEKQTKDYFLLFKQRSMILHHSDASDSFDRLRKQYANSQDKLMREDMIKAIKATIPDIPTILVKEVYSMIDDTNRGSIDRQQFVTIMCDKYKEVLERIPLLHDICLRRFKQTAVLIIKNARNSVGNTFVGVEKVSVVEVTRYLCSNIHPSQHGGVNALVRIFADGDSSRNENERFVDVKEFDKVMNIIANELNNESEQTPAVAGMSPPENQNGYVPSGPLNINGPQNDQSSIPLIPQINKKIPRERIQDLHDELRRSVKQQPIVSYYAYFYDIDTNSDNAITFNEFYSLISKFINISLHEGKIMFDDVDKKHNDQATKEELCDYLGMGKIIDDERLLNSIRLTRQGAFDEILKNIFLCLKKTKVSVSKLIGNDTKLKKLQFIKNLRRIGAEGYDQNSKGIEFLNYLSIKDDLIDTNKFKCMMMDYQRRMVKSGKGLYGDESKRNADSSNVGTPGSQIRSTKGLSREDLEEALEELIFELLCYYDNDVDRIVFQFDPNKDGVITEEEFYRAIKKSVNKELKRDINSQMYNLIKPEYDKVLTTLQLEQVLCKGSDEYQSPPMSPTTQRIMPQVPLLNFNFEPQNAQTPQSLQHSPLPPNFIGPQMTPGPYPNNNPGPQIPGPQNSWQNQPPYNPNNPQYNNVGPGQYPQSPQIPGSPFSNFQQSPAPQGQQSIPQHPNHMIAGPGGLPLVPGGPGSPGPNGGFGPGGAQQIPGSPTTPAPNRNFGQGGMPQTPGGPYTPGQMGQPQHSNFNQVYQDLSMMSPGGAPMTMIEILYRRIRHALNFNEMQLVNLLSEYDNQRTNKLNVNYVTDVLAKLGCHLNDIEKQTLFSSVAKSPDNPDDILYNDLIIKLFPQRSLVNIRNTNDLATELVNQQHMARKTLKELWMESVGSHKEMSLSQFKVMLAGRGLALNEETAKDLFQQLDSSRNYSIDEAEFMSMFQTNQGGPDVGHILAKRIHDYMKSMNKTCEDLLKPYANPEINNQLEFKDFSRAADELQLGLKYPEVELLFSHIDKDKSGKLSIDEIKRGIDNIDSKYTSADTNTVRMCIHKCIRSKSLPDGVNDLFALYAMQKSYLKLSDFTLMLKDCGMDIADSQIKALFEAIDMDGDYQIDLKELKAFYDEPTIMMLFPGVLQFKHVFVQHLRNSKKQIVWYIRKYSNESADEIGQEEFIKMVNEELPNCGLAKEELEMVFHEMNYTNSRTMKVSAPEIRRVISGQVVDPVILIERIQSVLRRSGISASTAFQKANRDGDQGLSYNEFYDLLSNDLQININPTEADELFSFMTTQGQSKVMLPEFLGIFESYSSVNPFTYNPEYIKSLPQDARQHMMRTYSKIMPLNERDSPGNNTEAGRGRLRRNPAYDRNKDKEIADLFVREGTEGTQTIPLISRNSKGDGLELKMHKVNEEKPDPHLFNEVELNFVRKVMEYEDSGHKLRQIFQRLDDDPDGQLSYDEFLKCVTSLDVRNKDRAPLNESETRALWKRMEPDMKGQVDFNRFERFYKDGKMKIQSRIHDSVSMERDFEEAVQAAMSDYARPIEHYFREMRPNPQGGLNRSKFYDFMTSLMPKTSMKQSEFDAVFKTLDKREVDYLTLDDIKRLCPNYEQMVEGQRLKAGEQLLQVVVGHYRHNGEELLQQFLLQDPGRTSQVSDSQFKDIFRRNRVLTKEDDLNILCKMFPCKIIGKVNYMKFLQTLKLISPERLNALKNLQNQEEKQGGIFDELAGYVKQYCQLNQIPIAEAFDKFVRDPQGSMMYQDFDSMVRAVYQQRTPRATEVDIMFNKLDDNRSGYITKEEFYKEVLSDSYREYLVHQYGHFRDMLSTIHRALSDRGVALLKDYYGAPNGLVNFIDFRAGAAGIGLQPESKEYYESLRAFEDREKPQHINVDKIQTLINEIVVVGGYQGSNRPPEKIPTAQFGFEKVEGQNAQAPAAQYNQQSGGNRFMSPDGGFVSQGPQDSLNPNQGNRFDQSNNQNMMYSSLDPKNIQQYPSGQNPQSNNRFGNPNQPYQSNEPNYPQSGLDNRFQQPNQQFDPRGNYSQQSQYRPASNISTQPRYRHKDENSKKYTQEQRNIVNKVLANIVNYLEEDRRSHFDVFGKYDVRRESSIPVRDFEQALYSDLFIDPDANLSLMIDYYTDPDSGKVYLQHFYKDLERMKKSKVDTRKFNLNMVKDELAGNQMSLMPREKLVGYIHPIKDQGLEERSKKRIQLLKDFFFDNFGLTNQSLFDFLDTNKDNIVVKKEFFAKTADNGFDGCTRDELDEVFKYIDTSKNGVISLREFKYHFFDRAALEKEAELAGSDLDDELRVLFRRIDSKNSGYVDAEDLVRCLHVLGFPVSPEAIIQECRSSELGKDRRLDFSDFKKFMLSKLRSTVFRMDNMLDEIRTVFRKIHPTDGQVFDLAQFATALSTLCPDLTGPELEATFFEVDEDRAGEIHIEDFISYLRRPSEDKESPLVANAILKIKKKHVLPLRELAAVFEDLPKNFCAAATRLNYLELKNLPCESLYPKLMANTLAFVDLYPLVSDPYGSNLPLKPLETRFLRLITLDIASGIPIPEATKINRADQIKGREVRVCLFDRDTHKFIGGTLAMPAVWKSEYEDRWYFEKPEKYCSFWVRAPEASNSLCVIFEFVIFLSYKNVDLQMSCGWTSFDLANMPSKNKEEILPLLGGSPASSTHIHSSDVRTERTTLFGKISKAFGGDIKSELKIKIEMQDRIKPNVKEALDLLPKTILVPVQSVWLWRVFRFYLGTHAYINQSTNSNLASDIAVKAFLRAMNVTSLHSRICDIWNQVAEPKFTPRSGAYESQASISAFEEGMINLHTIFDAAQFHFNKTDQTLEYYGSGKLADREKIVSEALTRLREIWQGRLLHPGTQELSYSTPFSIDDLLEDDFNQIGGL